MIRLRYGRHHLGPALALALLVLANGARAEASALRVTVSIKPVHSLVASVMKGVGTPSLLLDGASSPHAYSLKPSQARELQSADLVVLVSDHLETFLTKPVAQLPQRVRVVHLDGIAGLARHRLRGGGAFEADGHDHKHAGDEAGYDPHIWLDPRNAKAIALHMAEQLARLDPGHGDAYRANARAMASTLDLIEQQIAERLVPVKGRPFIVFHDAYQYFERRFGLQAAGAVSVSPDVPPSARRISELRSRVRQSAAACVFAEPQFPPRIIDSIVEGTGARRATLDPLGAGLPAGPDQYAMLISGLASELIQCLQRNG